MPIVAVVNQKGGSGKSTVSVHLACWLHQRKQSVVVVDADAQQSSSKWFARLEQEIPCQVAQSPDELLDALPKLAEAYTWVIVDGPAALSETTRATILGADLAIVPCQPTGVDLESASDTIRLIQQAQRIRRGEPRAVIFVNRAVKGTKLKDEAIEVLRLFPGVTGSTFTNLSPNGMTAMPLMASTASKSWTASERVSGVWLRTVMVGAGSVAGRRMVRPMMSA